ncbi:unnamed protein product [Eruca vesicaria subsp. sativa]|uniref:SHSP domain-containing protein n=1 Tax=Eruca vesicaria subsp. sativa TaxID=29727 RepID=A0ABC8L629_ERUVS|nr:unnamed protein product [Eruca vesicaria subsp. sativa]
MELELGMKITRTSDNNDVSSSTDFKVSRDVFGQVWHSRETDSVFILTLHLKGFKKKGIDTEINKEGDQITIKGRKKVEEMVLVKWVKWRKESEVKEFKKVFRIPHIVNLDKIKARFDEEDGTLTVTFPKKVKGITDLKIEEVEEAERKTEPETDKTEEKTESEAEKTEEKAEPEEEIKEEKEPEEEEEEEPKMEEKEEEIVEEDREETEEKESKPKRKKIKKFCFPCVAGSTLLMSIIVFIIQLIQSKRK